MPAEGTPRQIPLPMTDGSLDVNKRQGVLPILPIKKKEKKIVSVPPLPLDQELTRRVEEESRENIEERGQNHGP